ncbi:MAG: DUF2269 domain-containing protein [Pseudomonadota bacterium]
MIKTLHILSATVLFGTGLGIAFFFWSARHRDDEARLFAARTTVRADLLFTLPAVFVQPITGALLVGIAGFDPREFWLVASYALYVIAGLCWLPVVWLQIRMKRLLEQKIAGEPFDPAQFERLRRTWFFLGWPAFVGLVIVFWLMVTKPIW